MEPVERLLVQFCTEQDANRPFGIISYITTDHG